MSISTKVALKVSGALNRFTATDRVVFKRLLSRGGGDPLIGKPGTVVVTDTLMSPQPAVFSAEGELIINSLTNKANTISEYKIIAAVDSLSAAELEDPNTVFVFKDTNGNVVEQVGIKSYRGSVIGGEVVAWTVFGVSKKRG